MRHKRHTHKRNKRKSAKHTQIKRFKSADTRSRENRLLAVQQEAENRQQYHQLRLRYEGKNC